MPMPELTIKRREGTGKQIAYGNGDGMFVTALGGKRPDRILLPDTLAAFSFDWGQGTTIAFLAYDEIAPYSFAATDTTPGHAWLNETDLRYDVAQARPSADFVITFVHWGIEYFTDLTAHQRQLAQVAIDAGADLVVGAHPHVIEPYEFYKGKLIVYSLGNFVFDYMDAEVVRRGDILSLTIQKNRLLAWELVMLRRVLPVRLSSLFDFVGQPHGPPQYLSCHVEIPPVDLSFYIEACHANGEQNSQDASATEPKWDHHQF